MAYVVHASHDTKIACAFFNDNMHRAAGMHLWPAEPQIDKDGRTVRINVWYVPGTDTDESEPVSAPSNVVALPVKPRTSWTVLKHLDGRRWASGSGFSAGGAWSWILETVAHEHGVSEDQIGNVEGTEDQFDGDDLVTVDGLSVYRIEHTCTPFSK